jgi:PKD repeat protein
MKTTKTSFVRMAACLIAAALTSVACGIESQDAPSLIGPSGFGQSVTMNAVPDRLPRDGSSQSVITISVRNDSGQPVSGQRVTLGASHGSLSQSDVVTGNNGTATFTLTSPPPGSTGNMIEVYATAVTGNFDNAVTRSLSIAITGPGNSTAPTPQFVMTPENPGERETVTFDATTTTDEGGPCGNACTYSWNFGDGTTRTGAIVTHTFNAAGVYMVTLTVTDSGGASASRQRLVTVSRVASPTIASIAASPNPPLAGQLATFSATVTPAPNRTITNYEWNFGDGTSQTTSGPTVTKRYATQGVYVVTLTVTQDTGQTASLSQQVNISGSAVSATISISPTNPLVGQRVHFTALNPTAPNGGTVTSYEWSFGDSQSSGGGSASGQSVSHTYTVPATYTVRLTVTDSNGVVGVFTREVPVGQVADDDEEED